MTRQLRDPPESLRHVGQLCHQDVGLIFKSMEELVASLAQSLTPAQRAELGRYLTKILDGRFTRAELGGIWRRAKPEVGFPGGAKPFFEALRDAIAAAEAKR